jgi:hypothetical protein|nr:MAG TPA_asm: nucleoid-associated protein [Bacteriophage sp.]
MAIVVNGKKVAGVGMPGKDGAPGKDGLPGKSAYQAAVDGGYIGSEQEFNAALASIGDINAALDAINGEVV